jgi:glucose dehydrogenase
LDDKLLGSRVTPDAQFRSYWGEAGWYDAWERRKVCTDTLFAFDAASGKPSWTYHRGMVIHPTIAADDGKIYFVECRQSQIVASKTSQIAADELWQDQFMVALDAATGKLLWEKPYQCPGLPGVFYLVAAEGKLVLGTNVKVAGQKKPTYFAAAFSAADGGKLWSVDFPVGGDHGAHMSHPAVVAGRVYMRPKVIDLASGKIQALTMPGGGCGSYALSQHLLFFRAGDVAAWSLAADARTSSWHRLRPDCWISTIPAAGMLLSPEAGGGCSCGAWLELSIGFMPKPAQ